MLYQRSIGHDLAPEARVRHSGSLEEILDRCKQLGIRHDVHGIPRYHKFPTHQALMLGIYEIAGCCRAWDIPNMGTRPDKRESAQRSALTIADRLGRIRSAISERQWTKDAGVSPSFFSNLRGTPTKPPSDPSVDQLRQVLKVQELTLPEFFLPEGEGKVMRTPTQQAVERAFADALGALPSKSADRPRYLAQVVAGVLGLPGGLPAIANDLDAAGQDDQEASAPPRAATKQK